MVRKQPHMDNSMTVDGKKTTLHSHLILVENTAAFERKLQNILSDV
jgi:hypothetical protein